MTYPFTDKSSSYQEAYGFIDRSGSSFPLASALNGMTSAISGITVAASALNNLSGLSAQASSLNYVGGLTVPATSTLNLLSGLSAQASSLNYVYGLTVPATSTLNLLSGLSAQASSLNNVQGLTASGAATILNNSVYLGTANKRIMGFYSAALPTNGLAITCATALGITSVAYVFATILNTGTPTTTGATVHPVIDANSTAITFNIYAIDGTAVTAGIATGLVLNVMAIGT